MPSESCQKRSGSLSLLTHPAVIQQAETPKESCSKSGIDELLVTMIKESSSKYQQQSTCAPPKVMLSLLHRRVHCHSPDSPRNQSSTLLPTLPVLRADQFFLNFILYVSGCMCVSSHSKAQQISVINFLGSSEAEIKQFFLKTALCFSIKTKFAGRLPVRELGLKGQRT